MDRCFVVVSGLPGSGKSTLPQQLAAALKLVLLDKDDILERLFDSNGVGDGDWGRALSLGTATDSCRLRRWPQAARCWSHTGACLVCRWTRERLRTGCGSFRRESSVCIVVVTRDSRPNVLRRGSGTPGIWMMRNRPRRSEEAVSKLRLSAGSVWSRVWMWTRRKRWSWMGWSGRFCGC